MGLDGELVFESQYFSTGAKEKPGVAKEEGLIGLPVMVLEGGYFVVGDNEAYQAPEISQYAGDCLLVNQQVGATEMEVYERKSSGLVRGRLICTARRQELRPMSSQMFSGTPARMGRAGNDEPKQRACEGGQAHV